MNIEDIKKVNLNSGDMVVISFKDILTPAQRNNVRECMAYKFKSNDCLILDGGAKLDVITKEDIEGV